MIAKIADHLAVSLTAEQFRYSFGNAIEPGESDTLYRQWAIPAPGRILFEAAAANFSLHSPLQLRRRGLSSHVEGTGELVARRDPQLREQPVQVGSNCSR